MQSPEANLFTGGLSQAIAIRIPPGRKMATPNLNLVYSSGGGAGLYGEGWSLPIGSIERSTKWGVPLCTGAYADEFVLTLNGAATELVNFGTSGSDTVYRPRTDQSFLEAHRKQDNTWEVFERSGMRYVFGTTSASRRDRSPTCTTVWGLTQIKDPNDNVVDLVYVTGKQTLVLDRVEYGGIGVNQAFRVRFTYVGHPIPTTSWRNGTKEVVQDLVDEVHVEAKTSQGGGFGPVRVYDLKYSHQSPGPGCDAPDRVLLCEVSTNDQMPAQRFEYAPAISGLAAAVGYDNPGTFQHLRSATMNAEVEDSVMDMNGDGRLDFVNSANGNDDTWTVYYGLANGAISAAESTRWCAGGGSIESAHMRRETDFENNFAVTQKETIDLDGDGLPDFLDSTTWSPTNPVWKFHPGSLSVTCPSFGTVPGFVPAAIDWPAPEAYSTRSEKDMGGDRIRSWKSLADVNADGRADLVIANPAPGVDWTVFLNTGAAFVAQGPFANSAGPINQEDKVSGGPFGAERRTVRDLFDFNGDGLPDVVEEGAGAFLVRLNDGEGFQPTISVSASGLTDYAVRVVDNSSGEALSDFLDMNGDGLPDRVEWTGKTSWTVWINRGTSLAAPQTWLGGGANTIRDRNSKGNTKIDMVDWNHDGILDRVDARTNTWQVQRGQPASGTAIRPYLMTAAHNGAGGAFYPTYQPSTRFTNTLLPFVSWVVTATRRTDGLCSSTPSACLESGNEIQRTYTYGAGYFDGPTREFRGFGSVWESFPWTSAPGALVGRRETTFSQDDHTRGQIELVETKTAVWSGLPQTSMRETYVWDTRPDPGGGRTQVFLAEKKSEVFDTETGGGATQCRLDRNVAPDVYGRVETRCTLPCGTSNPGSCSDNPVGQVTTVSVWANPSYTPGTQPAVRERPASVTVSYVKAGGSETLSQQNFVYAWPAGNVLTATTIGDATTGGDATVTTAYGNHGNMESVTDARGGQSTSGYGGTPFSLFPSSETNAVGHTVQTTWDLRYGKETQVTGPNGELTAATYDAAGRVTCEAKPGNSCPGTPSAAYTYVYGNPSAGTFEGKLSYVEVKTREPNNTAGPLPGYLLTRSYFDGLGRERATATWRVVGSGGSSGNDLSWVVTKQIDYFGLGKARKVYAPYETGPAGTGMAGLAASPATAFTEYEYFAIAQMDPTGRVRKVIAPDASETRTEYAGSKTHVYDAEDNKTTTEADFLGREVSRKLYDGTSTLAMQYDYTYDGLDRLLTTTVGGSLVTQKWDRLGRMREVVDPDSGTWQTRFDLGGNARLQDDPKTGQRVEACHDKANRVVLQCAYPSDGTAYATSCNLQVPAQSACGAGGSEIARYTYDIVPLSDAECGGPGKVGQLTAVSDASGGECWAYDTRGRVTKQKKTVLVGATPTTAKTVFAYPADADHLLSIQYPDLTTPVAHGYQADGTPKSIAQILSDVDYDLFGRATKITSARNTEDLYVYDTTGADNFRLQTIQTKQSSSQSLFLSLGHSYTPRGKLETVSDALHAGGPLSNAAGYCYDGLGRLIKVDRDPAGGSPCTAAADEWFSHDDKGNVTAKNGSAFGFAAGPHQATSFGSTYTAIAYDANGSRTRKDKGSGTYDELLYDARGLLTQVKRYTGGSLTSSQTSTYDYAGARVVRAPSSGAGATIRTYSRYADVSGSILTKYFYLGDRLLASWAVGAPAHLIAGDGDPQAVPPPPRLELPPQLLVPVAGTLLLLLALPLGRRRRLGVRLSLARSASLSIVFLTASSPVVLLAGCGGDPAVRVFHTDRLGSTQVVTDWNGNAYRYMRYFAYGEIRGRFDSWGNPAAYASDARFEFTGYETDFAGLDYAGARFFDPELAQFASHDPAGQYPSPYAYGPGDPVNGSDPSGEFYEMIVFAALQQIAAAIDTYRETGDSTKAWQAGLAVAIDHHTLGIYSLVKAISHDEAGHYLANAAASTVTFGIYGTVRAFADGRVASGVVGIASLAYSTYSRLAEGSPTVSGTEKVGGGFEKGTMNALAEGDQPPTPENRPPVDGHGGWVEGVEIVTIITGLRSLWQLGKFGVSWAAGRIALWRLSRASIDDVLANPEMLKLVSPTQVEAVFGKLPGWRVGTLGEGSKRGAGWALREITEKGTTTGRYLRWRPGGGRHGPNPYWKVSDGTRSTRVFQE
jgi:RHS repeat-associated protein